MSTLFHGASFCMGVALALSIAFKDWWLFAAFLLILAGSIYQVARRNSK